jgi:non-specific serine/threonine protein kinase
MPASWTLTVSPNGALHVAPVGRGDALAGDEFPRIRAAFERGAGAGLLHLGAVEVTATLPLELAYFRDFGRLFVTRFCGLPGSSARRGNVEVPVPEADVEAFARAAPPMPGAEYLSTDALRGLWKELERALTSELAEYTGSVEAWLAEQNPVWHLVGRVVFHLAENKRDPEVPFAFLATYVPKLTRQARVQHVALSRALEEYHGDRSRLLALLEPVHRAATKSALVRELLETGDLFHPLAWTTAEAHAFLKTIPELEDSGVIVRVPDWWHARRPPRPRVTVRIGDRKPAGLGTEALLDFRVDLTLDGEPLTEAERRRIATATAGLVLVRGRWIEVDRERLEAALSHWNEAARAVRDGVSFGEALRVLSGSKALLDANDAAALDASREWSRAVAGDWLERTLAELCRPEATAELDVGGDLHAVLRPYQRVGLRWLHSLYRLELGGCLADDMGLGKTLQVIALIVLLRRESARRKGRPSPALIVVPASLLANWASELARFAPGLSALVAHTSALGPAVREGVPDAVLERTDVVVTTYGAVRRFPWIRERAWNLVVLDEAQAIKNPGAAQTRAVKALRSPVRFALTGTPVENRLSDLWSIFDFLAPGLLGSARAFGEAVKKLERAGGQGYAPLRELLRPYILRRMKTDRSIITDLPEKTEVVAFCGLSKTQAVLYQHAIDDLAQDIRKTEGMKRRGLVLAALTRLKQICNHPSQFLRDGEFAREDSGKFARLAELLEPVAEEKVLVFTQFREMTEPLARELRAIFGRDGLVLHGGTPVAKRKALVDAFQGDGGPPFFVVSLKAGGSGLNLTAASHVVHFDRWWNPAVENQATDRAFRIGQKKNVLVHKFVCRGTVEERIDRLIEDKKRLAGELVEGGGEAILTEMSPDELLDVVRLDLRAAVGED